MYRLNIFDGEFLRQNLLETCSFLYSAFLHPILFFEGGQDMNDELRRLLMEQMQLLHEQSRADAILPGELAELSNAMTSIAGVLLQLK